MAGAVFPANVASPLETTLITLADGASITPLSNAGLVGNYFVMGVPEPTVTLLGAFGVLGLVRRRR